MAALLQSTSIFVSTLSITAIALDRRKLIVYPHEPAYGGPLVMTIVPLIWLTSLALASPMAIWKKLENWTEWADSMDVYEFLMCTLFFSPLSISMFKKNLAGFLILTAVVKRVIAPSS